MAPGDGPDPAPSRVRVALVADTHGFLDPRIEAIAAACDRVVHAGDIGDDGILAALDRPPAAPAVAVRGNNDTERHWPADAQTRRAGLAEAASLPLPGGELVVVHGHRLPARNRHARLRRQYPAARAIVCGHSHRLALDTGTIPWVLNPGAAGRSRTYGGPSCLVLVATMADWTVTPYRFDRGP